MRIMVIKIVLDTDALILTSLLRPSGQNNSTVATSVTESVPICWQHYQVTLLGFCIVTCIRISLTCTYPHVHP